MVPSVAPSQRARSIVPCRLTLAVLQPWLQRALALHWQSRAKRVVPPSMGLQHTQRAWGLAPASRARHRRVMVPSVAPSQRARSIVPCRLTLAVLQPWLQRALALHWQSRAKRVVPPSMGLQHTQRAWGLAPASRARHRRLMVPSVAPSQRARSIVPCRLTLAVLQPWLQRALALHWQSRAKRVVPPSMGLQHTQRAWGLAPASRARHRRLMVPSVAPSQRARSIVPCRLTLAVLQPWLQRALALHWQSRAKRVVPPSMGLQHTQRAWGLAPASRARHRRLMVPSVAPSQRARSIVPCRLTLAVLQPWLQRALALHWQSRAKRVVPPSMGLQHTQRAWGLAPASRARHRRFMVPSAAPSQRARSIVPCRLTLAVLQPWLQRALALHWQSRAKRVVPPSMGLQHTQRAWGLAPASRARHRRLMVPSVAPSQRARSIVPCRLTLAVLQPWLQRALALHWQSRAKRVVPPSMGLQHTQRAWGLAPASRARHRRLMVPSVAPSQRARSIVPCRLTLAVLQPWLQRALALHWQSRAKRVVPPSMGLQHTQRAWGLAPASRARHRRLMVPSVAPSQRARSIVPCRLTLAVLQPWLQRALALHWQSRAKRVVPPSMGLQHTQRAWGLAPASRARHRRFMVPSVAPSQRARSIVPCRLTLAVLQPWLQRALALHWQSRAKRVVPPSMGLQHTQRAWGLAPASRARHRRLMVPSVAPSQRARSIVPCRLTLAVLQPWLQRALALHWQSRAKRVVPPSMGLQHTQRAWGLAPASRARHRRLMVPSVAPSQRARSIVPCRLTLAVLQPWLQRALALHWQSRAKRVVPPSMGLQHTQRAWGLAPASRARHRRFMVPSVAPSQRARSIVPCRLTLAVLQPWLQRALALHWQSRAKRVVPPSMGLQHTQRAWGLAPASRARHRRVMVPSVAPSQRARSIVPCRLTLAVLQPWLQRALALHWQSRAKRVVPPSMGLQHTQRAWGLAPASRARHRRLMVPSVAPSQRARSIVPCRLTLAVLQPWLQRALALHWQSRAKRVVPPSMGLQHTQRAWGLAPASRARHRRLMVPSVAPSQRARSIVPCRLTLAVLQPWLQRALALHWQSRAKRVVPPSMGLQHTQRAWGLAPASRARHRRLMVPSVAPSQRARSIVPCRLTLAVLQPWLQRALALHWQSRAKRVVPPSMGLQHTQRAWGLAPASRARHRRLMVPSVAPSQRARSIVPCRLTLAVLQPCLQRALALHWQSREERV